MPAIEVRVNFGVFAGRDATAAEIDRLAEWLLDEVGEVSIISEERHEIDARRRGVGAPGADRAPSGVPADDLGRRALERRILERAEHWARTVRRRAARGRGRALADATAAGRLPCDGMAGLIAGRSRPGSTACQ